MKSHLAVATVRSFISGLDLPEGDVRQPVLWYLYDELARVFQPLAVITAINAIAVAALYYHNAGPLLTTVWLVPLLFFSWMQFRDAKRMLRRPREKELSNRFLKRGAFNTCLFGVWWSATAIVFSGNDLTDSISLTAMNLGMMAAAASSLGANAGLSARFIIGSFPLTIYSAINYSYTSVLLVSILGTTLIFTLIYMANLKFRDIVHMLEYRLNLERAQGRLEAGLNVSGIGIQMTDSQKGMIAENTKFREHAALIGAEWPKSGAKIKASGVDLVCDTAITEFGDTMRITRDITETIKANNLIIKAKRQAEDALESKIQFVDSITDEFRLPLNTLKGAIQLIMPDSKIAFTQEELNQIALQMDSSTQDLDVLLDAFLKNPESSHEQIDLEAFSNLQTTISNQITDMRRRDSIVDNVNDIDVKIYAPREISTNASKTLARILDLAISACVSDAEAAIDLMLFSKAGSGGEQVFMLRSRSADRADGVSTDLFGLTDYLAADVKDIEKPAGFMLIQKHLRELGGTMQVYKKQDGITQFGFNLPATYFRDVQVLEYGLTA